MIEVILRVSCATLRVRDGGVAVGRGVMRHSTTHTMLQSHYILIPEHMARSEGNRHTGLNRNKNIERYTCTSFHLPSAQQGPSARCLPTGGAYTETSNSLPTPELTAHKRSQFGLSPGGGQRGVSKYAR